ncbi:hypothetical protein Hypma_001724 [Hypsizygus marmoreus]|uniref:MICOS complex subunit MIC12 n=1 Tax=Hypsizygus marmoreus TaxID=39966 RepID=A0A369JA15_HYPMA|nr:hypothetical protein Hypma_001724 [Hypsizygus marmoreus]
MSFLISPVSGALVAGGVYYGFSNLITTRTEQHRKDLHTLSVRLTETPTLVQGPPPAAARITHHPFVSILKAKWNQDVEYLFRGFNEWDRRAQDWGKKLLYGTDGRASTSSPADTKST